MRQEIIPSARQKGIPGYNYLRIMPEASKGSLIYPSFLRKILLLAAFLCIIAPALHAYASQSTESETASNSSGKKYISQWVVKNQSVYYYLATGKKARGFTKIRGKYYYFDKTGVQRTGWQKIGSAYYYFRIINGRRGYMQTSQIINGIQLKKSGKAKLTSYAKKKLPVLVMANQLVQKWTKPKMTKARKLKICWDRMIAEYPFLKGGAAFKDGSTWEIDYARSLFEVHAGMCYEYGAGFAFLASAIGYTDVNVLSNGVGHGWCEINGKIYDAAFAQADLRHSYYGMPYELSNVDGRPSFANSRARIAKI